MLNSYLAYDPSGYEIPYLSKINYEGDEEMLVLLSLQILMILCEYKPPTEDNAISLIHNTCLSLKIIKERYTQVQVPNHTNGIEKDLSVNRCADLIRGIRDTTDLTVISDSYINMFNNIQQARNTYLPGSKNSVPWYQSSIIFFWRLIQSN